MKSIGTAARAIGRVSASYWATHTNSGKIWLTMGLIALIVDAALCYQYGVTQTTWHGIGFAVVALFFAKLPDGAYEEYNKGNKIAGVFLGLLTIPLGAVAYQSHIGYGAGVRMGDVKKANVQQAKYDGAQDTVGEDAKNFKLWSNQLETLMERDAWTATTTADALRKELATVTERIESEKKGQRGRKAGCGKECERLQNEAVAIGLRIATVEQRENLTKNIEATKRKLDAARAAAANTDAGMSSVAMQTDANTQMFGVMRAMWTGESLEKAMKTSEETAKLANLIITAAGSLAFMLMAPIGFFMAGRNRHRDDESDKQITAPRPSTDSVQAINQPQPENTLIATTRQIAPAVRHMALSATTIAALRAAA